MANKPTATTMAPTQDKGGLFNVLMRRPNATNPQAQQPERKIICNDQKISKADKEALIKLYEALVPGDKTRTVNVNMIMEQALPAFEETLGETGFRKLKKFFGIGCRSSKFGTKPQEINILLEQIRTIENAQYYIDGYKELLEMAAAKLHGAPEEMTMLERAKFVRMYHMIFVGYFFFAQDFRRSYSFDKKCYYLSVDFQEAFKNNSMICRPEDFFITSRILIESFPEDSLMYDLVCLEFSNLDKKLQKEILQFAELRIDDEGKLVSVNIAPKYQTYSSIRALKHKVHPEMGVYPMEFFAYKNKIQEMPFEEIYQIYKILRVVPMDKFNVETKKESYMEGSREVLRDRPYYEVCKDFYVSGQAEIDRIIRTMEYLSAVEFELETGDGKKCNMGQYMAAFNFMHGMEYIDVTIQPKREFELAAMLIERDTSGAIMEFKNGMITAEELKLRLGIDATFEKEIFGIETVASPIEIAEKFAVDNKYVSDYSKINSKLLENVVLLGNEEEFIKFAKGEIDEETLKRKIGFEESFAEMYFDLTKVDMAAIENQLQELKRGLAKKGEMKRWALLISLYCYLVEEQVPCGPKNKVPKRNKGLKPANLKAQIA